MVEKLAQGALNQANAHETRGLMPAAGLLQ
jgi:hypothetical protein